MAEGQSAVTGDIQSPQAPRGQVYGEAGRQLAGQEIVPLSGNPYTSSPHASSVATAPVGSPPGSGLSPDAASIYPDEPLTTGLPVGPGSGPEALMLGGQSPELSRLRIVYNRFRDESLRQLLEYAEKNPS